MGSRDVASSRPIAGVMLGALTWDFIKKSKNSMGWISTIIVLVISIIIMQILGLHPAILIVGLLVAALFSRQKQKDKQVKAS